MKVNLHWAERFINWYPYNTRLYMRKKPGQAVEFHRDGKELFDQLVPFFDKLREEIYRLGWEEGYAAAAERYCEDA